MKNKLLLLILVVCLSVCTLSVVSHADSDGTPELNFYSCSLVSSNTIYFRYYATAFNVSSISDVKLLIWTSPQTDYVKGTENYCLSPTGTFTYGGQRHPTFSFTNVSPKNITDDYFAVVYYENDGQAYYSQKVLKYSMLQYAYNQLGITSTGTTDQNFKNLLNAMLEYGAMSQIYFDNYHTDRLATYDYYQVRVYNALLTDKYDRGLYLPGDEVTFTANAAPLGQVFSHWTDEDGKVVGLDSTMTVTVGEEHKKYTANYREADTLESYFRFTENGDGTYSIAAADVDNLPASLVLPSTYNGSPVVSVANGGFKNAASITSVKIPAGYTSIARDAFAGCTSLASVALPATVESVGAGALSGCTALTSVTTDAASTLGWAADFSDSEVAVTTGNNNVTTDPLFDYVVYGTDAYLTNYKGTDTVVEIPEMIDGYNVADICYAFYNDANVTAVIIPQAITSVKSGAFDGAAVDVVYVMANVIPEGLLADKYTVVTGFTGEEVEYTFGENKISSVYALSELPVPEKNGYTFGGWYTASDLSGVAITAPYYSAVSLQLYPKWTPNDYTLTVDDGMGGTSDISVIFDEDYTLTVPERAGYTFAGWYMDGKPVTEFVWNYTENKTVVAEWTPNPYKAIFSNSVTGIAVETVVDVTYGSPYFLPELSDTDDYKFLGWTVDGVFYSAGEYRVWNFTTDKVFVAQWELIPDEGGEELPDHNWS